MKNEFLTPRRLTKTVLILVAFLFVFSCSPQTRPIPVSSLEQELENSEHPLRLLLEKHLETPNENDAATIKRKLRSLQVHDLSKEQFDVRWDEYRYKSALEGARVIVCHVDPIFDFDIPTLAAILEQDRHARLPEYPKIVRFITSYYASTLSGVGFFVYRRVLSFSRCFFVLGAKRAR